MSRLPLTGGLGHPRRLLKLAREVMAHPEGAVALVVVLMATRSEHVLVTDSPAGRALRDYLDRRFLGLIPQNRFCQGVLLLPASHADYLRGHRRQALRTNVRRALDAGISCTQEPSPASALSAVLRVLANRRAPLSDADRANASGLWPQLFARPEVTTLVARDRDGEALAVMAAVIDDSLCLISLAVASSHEARWALHDHLVRHLIERRVRYLMVEGDGPLGALGFSPQIHHYQHLLGYQLRHMVPWARR